VALADAAPRAHAPGVQRPTGSALPLAEPPRHGAGLRSSASGAAAQAQAPSSTVRRLPVIPERYALREKDGVRFLECDEAPRLRAIIDPELSLSRSDAAALGARVILLDGAGDFGPLIDNEKQLYNLDHHAGCERLFTLSTCEQALLLVQSGLELSEGDWRLYANDPDLDTVLALWCLLNHRRVRELRAEARDVLLPLFRLEGAIDANGPELARLCGLPTRLLEETQRRIDSLLARERRLKQTGSWGSKNAYAYTLEILRALDALAYTRDDFGDYTRIEEVYGHVEVAPRRVAVACRDRSGIYTVEQHLKSRWGDQLSIIALENQPGNYTLRRLSSVAGPQLEPAYELLNRVDAAVDGRPPGKRWGGSKDIGGSPRPGGTKLAPDEVLEILARAHHPSTWWTRTRRVAGALLAGMASLLFWPLAQLVPSPAPALALALPAGVSAAYQVSLASLLALLVATLATRAASRRRPWSFGWRAPASGGGLWLSPLALMAAAPVVAWVGTLPDASIAELLAGIAAGALAVVAIEAWFRGLVHGLLALDFRVQRPRGPWLLSRAAFVSATAYALAVTAALAGLAQQTRGLAALGPSQLELLAGVAALAFAVGLALAVIRERSLSLLPGIAIQLVGLLFASGLWWAIA
jgi:hypothetical protein